MKVLRTFIWWRFRFAERSAAKPPSSWDLERRVVELRPAVANARVRHGV